MKFEFLEHTADIKFRAFGKTIEESFENSAIAVFNSISEEKIKPAIKKEIKIIGKDLENLLYNFLEELIFLLDTKNFFLSKIKVKITEKRNLILNAKIFGDDVNKYETKMDVKAVTYNEMFVKKIGKKWVCQVVLDV